MECGKEILKLWTHNGHNFFRILAEDEGEERTEPKKGRAGKENRRGGIRRRAGMKKPEQKRRME